MFKHTSKVIWEDKNLKKIIKEQVSEQLELQKYGIEELTGGLTLDILKQKFSWILRAKIKNAVIGKENIGFDKIIWYEGTWEDGIWENGTWKYGIWENGTWINGDWHKGTMKDWKGGIW